MPNVVKIDKWNPDPAIIERAASVLKEGGLVAFPTETVYGLGADGLRAEAVRKIYAAKGRPQDNPLILHFSAPQETARIAKSSRRALDLMEEFWPGPLTLVLPLLDGSRVPKEVTAGLSTVAIRMPAHPVALALIEATGRPLAAPSANRSGRPSPTDARAVAEDLGRFADMILDAGGVDIGLESTVIDLTGEDVLLLRPGGLPAETIAAFLGSPLRTPGASDSPASKRSPGVRYRHYAPDIDVLIWDKKDALFMSGVDPALSGFVGLTKPPVSFARSIIFDSPESYARGLFASFREMESDGACRRIVAEWPEAEGIGLALRDRIKRAAAR
ncbi:threonylcarbamoyl-AMP synthase [Synergistales bacterium]|nr:threonylcarbamoyl-AMP synthase [Synergistales bacterium]